MRHCVTCWGERQEGREREREMKDEKREMDLGYGDH